jgi:hypothetical protein
MHPKQFKTDDPFTNPEAAARELIRLCKLEMEETGQPHAYTGTVNNAFRSGGRSTVASYSAGRDYAIAQGWLVIDISGTRITVTPEGEDA